MSNQSEQSYDKYQYSFTKDFQSFGYIKKLLTILFLPLMPIFIVSKGFQMRAWRIKKGEHPPSAKKYYLIMILVYIILQLPIYITIGYFYLLIALWPLTIILSIYLHRYDYSKERIKHGTKSDEFKVIGFRKLSITFLLLLLFTIILTFGGVLWLWLTATSIIFILFPGIYKKLYFIPKKFLVLSYSFFSFLNFIPGIYVAGDWFIEKDSEVKLLNNPYHIIKRIISNYEPFFILNIGITALLLRILIWLRGEQIPNTQHILSTETLPGWGFLFIFIAVPIIMSIYFSWVWVWEDAELKVAKEKTSTGTSEGPAIKETTLLVPVSDSIKRLFTYLFGLTPIIWLLDMLSTHDFKGLPTGLAGVAVVIVFAFFLTGVSTIFMGMMYYRSGAHEYLVNKLRSDIKAMYVEGNSTIKVCYSGIQEVDPNVLVPQPVESD